MHVPFCRRRCDYCAFATWTDKAPLMDDYVEAILKELATAQALAALPGATSVFVGGGTPSLLGGARLARILAEIETRPGAELSVECNPESTTPELLESLVEAGVTRISLGAQSLVPHVLAGLGRDHDPDEVRRAVALIGEAGVFSYNLDLIYGGAGERDEDWAATLAGVLALDPPPSHVSAYALTVEPGTPLARDPARHPDEDLQARRYAMAETALSGAGLSWYELSNWARPGHECRHNANYWAQGAYRGLGCAAHSHEAGHRSWNVRPLERYLAAVTASGAAVAGEERLSPDEAALEALQLSLRTRAGVPAAAVAPGELDRLLDAGPDGPLLEPAGDRYVLSLRGRLLANEVAMALRPPG